MQFCGLTILTDRQYAKNMAAAQEIQRKIDKRLVSRLLWNAEQYRIVAQGLFGRVVKLPQRL